MTTPPTTTTSLVEGLSRRRFPLLILNAAADCRRCGEKVNVFSGAPREAEPLEIYVFVGTLGQRRGSCLDFPSFLLLP